MPASFLFGALLLVCYFVIDYLYAYVFFERTGRAFLFAAIVAFFLYLAGGIVVFHSGHGPLLYLTVWIGSYLGTLAYLKAKS